MDFKHTPKRVGYKINIPGCLLVIAIAVVIAIASGIVIVLERGRRNESYPFQ